MNEEPEDKATDLARSTGVQNPLVLLQSMIEKGTDPDALKKMMDLALTWEANRAAKAFSEAMCDVQAEMPSVVKDAENTHSRTRYALRETIARTIKPVYTKHGFALSFSTADCPIAEHIRIVAEVTHREGHVKIRHFDIPLDGKGSKGNASGMNAPQATGSTYSYGIRYATLAIFNVAVAGEDDDAVGCGRQLSGGQILAINNAIEAITEAEAQATAAGKVLKKSFDFKRFCQWASGDEKADSLDAVPASKFDTAMDFLERRRKEVAK